jgi:sortase A
MSEKPPASHEKISHWDRPKPPHDWRWVIGGIGRTLITLGLLMFAFVAYQLWGTGIQTAQAQRSLAKEFDQQIADTDPVTTTTPPTTTTDPTVDSTLPGRPSSTTTTTTPRSAHCPTHSAGGEGRRPVDHPATDLNRIVVEGATADALTKGPGHFPETPSARTTGQRRHRRALHDPPRPVLRHRQRNRATRSPSSP